MVYLNNDNYIEFNMTQAHREIFPPPHFVFCKAVIVGKIR